MANASRILRLQQGDAGTAPLFREAIHADLEILTLADSPHVLCRPACVSDPLVQKVLAGKSPRDRAAEIDQRDKSAGRRLPPRTFTRALPRRYSRQRTRCWNWPDSLTRKRARCARCPRQQGELKQQAHAALARARNAALGHSRLPGRYLHAPPVLRCRERLRGRRSASAGDHHAGARSTERAKEMKNRPPFDLPPLWEKRRSRLNAKTGAQLRQYLRHHRRQLRQPHGESRRRVRGIIFDGNLQSLPWDYAFSERQGRRR